MTNYNNNNSSNDNSNNNNNNSSNAAAAAGAAAPIPVGFRFHPTDEELVGYYLHGKVGRAQRDQLIQELDLYKIEPWDLHELCRIGDDAAENQSDWYFFSHKDKKYPTGNRANRATAAGFWKATGRDKPIHTQRHVIGMRKTLVFYLGRAPHGQKTDWIMHEFRLDSDNNGNNSNSHSPGLGPNYESDGWVVCRVFRKTKNFKTKSQEDTSCSFDAADPDNPSNNNNNNQQLLSEQQAPQFVSKGGGPTGNHHPAVMVGAGDYHSNNAQHHHFNFTCKQELTVDDYPCSFTVLQDPRARANYETFQQQQHHNNYSHQQQEFISTSTTEDARSSCSFINNPPNHHHAPGGGGGHVEDWMEQSRLRRDQTLADVTCHLSGHHVKRPNFVSHENLVHLWN